MLEKKRQDKIKMVIPLEKTLAEILVANGRAVEPFVKVFTYSGENVTKDPLGTLVGVFEIAQRSEDSAYIVNFLASVAKKEYFNNSRRSAIESFEAALHKINLALAELVKHGNVVWLGKFHGALGVLEKNGLHFSVTGKAQILLLRNNNLSEISAGLASEESHLHPIKTFVEVSSGNLLPQDKVIFTSPELLELVPIEDLEKNSLRMDEEHFSQFLRTALVNELDMAGAIVVDFQEGKPLPSPKKQEEKATNTPINAFSQNTFIPKTKAPEIIDSQKENPPKEEHVDPKTGHIYVHGDTIEKKENSQNLEQVKLLMQNMLHGIGSFFTSQGKLLRKGRKHSGILFSALARTSTVAARKTVRFIRKQLKKKLSSKKPLVPPLASTDQASPEITFTPPKQRELQPLPTLHISQSQITPPEKKLDDISPAPVTPPSNTEIPLFMQAKLAAFYQKNTPSESITLPETTTSKEDHSRKQLAVFTKNILTVFSFIAKIFQKSLSVFFFIKSWLLPKIKNLLEQTFFFLKNRSLKQWKLLFLGSIVCIILFIGITFFSQWPPKNAVPVVVEVPKPQIEEPVSPLTTEKNAHALETPVTITTQENTIITSVLLNNETYLITKKSIISISDNKPYTLPENSTAQFATVMDHLGLVFIYTDSNELFAWSPINHTFVKNTLILPTGSIVRGIGTYLTYLYVLDDTTNQIYRFPRAEGGFGQSSTWLKDSVIIESVTKIAVNETIFLAQNNTTVGALFRGRLVKNLESPSTSLSLTSLYTHPGLANVYALDAQNKRILVWNQDGVLLTQYFSDILADAKTITVNEKTSEALVTTTNTLLSFKINSER